jgi:hypothetical protein
VVALPLALGLAAGGGQAGVQGGLGRITLLQLAAAPEVLIEVLSAVSTVPQGVRPPPQLLRVPSTVRPAGSSAVCSSGWPASGPLISMGVVPVMRRLKGLPGSYLQPRPVRRMATTDAP